MAKFILMLKFVVLDCQRTIDEAFRYCTKSCSSDSDCKSNQKCLCDEDCGMSCVRNSKCVWYCMQVNYSVLDNLPRRLFVPCGIAQETLWRQHCLTQLTIWDILFLSALKRTQNCFDCFLKVIYGWTPLFRLIVAWRKFHVLKVNICPSFLRRGSSVRYINPLCEVYHRREVEWTDNSVPGLTLLSGSNPPEKKNPLRGRE